VKDGLRKDIAIAVLSVAASLLIVAVVVYWPVA
jgi:hypothetical protein